MVKSFFPIIIDPQLKQFDKDIKKIARGVEDLRPALLQVRKQWYQGNNSLLTLNGPGKYQDLAPSGNTKSNYKETKERTLGFAYPILLGATGELLDSVTREDSPHAYSKVTKKDIELGTAPTGELQKYAFAQQFGSKKQNIPARPYVLLGIEQVATKDQKQKTKVYLDLIADYVEQVSNDT